VDGDLVLQLKTCEPAELGRRIKRLRQQRGMTQGQLAGGVASTAYVSRIEAGLRRPDASVLEGLAGNLDVEVAELLIGEATPLRSRVELDLNAAEWALSTGAPAEALDRLASLPAHVDADQRQRARLLEALIGQALGVDPIPALQELASDKPANLTTWLRAQTALCRALCDNGELDSAAVAGELALEHLESLELTGTDDGVRLAVTLAGIYELRGELPEALRLAEETLARADEAATPRARAYAYWNASLRRTQESDIGSAIAYADRALTLLGSEDDARQRALLRTSIGRFHLRADQPDIATALEILATAGRELTLSGASAVEIAATTVETARGHVMSGDTATADVLVAGVLAQRDGLGAYLTADALVLRGEILAATDAPAALDSYHEAVEALASGDQDRAVARLWYQIAARFEAIGDTPAALDAYRRGGVASGVLPTATASRALV
jgi:transcriptional regulator with XRE-family HTH domain